MTRSEGWPKEWVAEVGWNTRSLEVNELRGLLMEESSTNILKSPRIMTGVVEESES